jgi:hypothetical protein
MSPCRSELSALPAIEALFRAVNERVADVNDAAYEGELVEFL